MPISEIGVSRMRSWPNSSDRPSVTVNAPPKPPGMPMSSPMQKTRSSRSHLLADRLAQRLGNGHCRHGQASSARKHACQTASAGGGSGLASAKAIASSISASTSSSICVAALLRRWQAAPPELPRQAAIGLPRLPVGLFSLER